MWIISFWIVIISLGAQRWSILPWGTPVKIDFTREKTTLPTPKCSLIVVPKVFRTTKTILAWLRTESLRATKNKRLFNFALREMLSRNNRPFLDTSKCKTASRIIRRKQSGGFYRRQFLITTGSFRRSQGLKSSSINLPKWRCRKRIRRSSFSEQFILKR